MTLTSGTKHGPDEIKLKLGAGGMGGAYRTRDARFERNLVINVLAEMFTRLSLA